MHGSISGSVSTYSTAAVHRRLVQLAVLLVVVTGSLVAGHHKALPASACCDNAISSISGSPNPATTADTVIITAQVCETTSNFPYHPGGYVTLSDTSASPVAVLGTPALVPSGSAPGCSTATLTTSALSIGDHVIKLVAYPTALDNGGAPLNGGTDRIYTQTVTAPSSGGPPPISIGSNTAPTTIGCIYCDGQARFLAPGRNGYVGVGAGAIPVAGVAEPGGTLKNLSIAISSADGGFWNFAVLVNHVGAGIGCNLSPGELTCVDASLAHAVSINSGDTVELAIGNPGTAFSTGSFSVAWTLELDPSSAASSPPPPAITAPANGSTTSSTSVLVSGTGIAGASVSILDGGTPVGSAVIDGAGAFSTTVSLSIGAHTLTTTQTASGQTSAASNAVSLTVTISRANPTIATTLSQNSVPAGQTAFDTASLSGATSDAGGTVTYSVYIDSSCSTQYSSAGFKTVTNGSVPPSDPVTFNTAGTRYWRAVYSGDANNNGVSSDCTSEPITVTALSPCMPPTNGLVSCWAAEGNTSDSADGNNGTPQGSLTYVAGKVGAQAFSLPNGSAFVSIGNPANLKLSSGITIAAWVNPSQAPVTCGVYPYLASIVTKWSQNFSPTSGADSYGLWLCTKGASSNVFSAIHLASGAGTSELNLQAGSVPTNAWSHVAMTYDGGTGQFAIYVNGQPVSSVTTGPDAIFTTDAAVQIGHEASYLVRPFTGGIDDVRIYNRGLTACEVSQLAQTTCVVQPPTITAPASGLITNQTTLTVAGSGASGASIAIADGANPAATTVADGAGAFSTSVSLAAGDHSLTATQMVAGSTSAASNAVTVTIDTTPPAISITGISDGQYSNAAALTPAFTATDSHLGPVSATLDGAPYTSGAPVSTEGAHTLVVTAQDLAGNSASATVHFTIDRTPPVIAVTGVSDGALSNVAISPAFSATDANLGTVSATLDGTSFSSGQAVSAEGSHTLLVTATDLAGNSATAHVAFTIDTTPPVLHLPSDVTAEATGPTGAVVSYTASASDGIGVNAPLTCVPASGATFALGTTTVACTATDAAGNKATGSFKVNVQDTTPPTISGAPGAITVPATGPGGAAVTYATPTATDLVDGAVPVVCLPASGSTFAPGTTTVICGAADRAGNKASSHFAVTVQPGAPSITAPADGSRTKSTVVTVSGTGINGGTITILDGTTNAGTTSVDATGHFSTSVTLTPGQHSLTAKQSVAGVGGAASSSVAVFVDTTVPDTTITSAPRPLDNRASAHLSFNAANDPDDTAFTFECLIDTGSFAPCTSPKDLTGLSDGSHTFKVRAIDAAGNVDQTPATFTWTVDTTPPTVSITSVDAPADGFLLPATGLKLPATVGAGPITVHGTASDANGIASVTLNGITATVAADGSWTAVKVPILPGNTLLIANARDMAGNAAQLLPDPVVTLKLDLDGDGIANNIDGDCSVRPPKSQVTIASKRFCDVPLGGRTSGSIVSVPSGMTVAISNATPKPGKGVIVKVTGARAQRARVRLDRKAVTVALAPGTYILTDPTLTTTVEVMDGGTAEFEFTLNGALVIVSVPDGGAASVTETQDAAGNLVGAQVTPIAGTVTINAIPVGPGQSLTFGRLDAELALGSDDFQLRAAFTPAAGSNGIDPTTDALTLQIGGFSATLPPGSFKAESDDDAKNQRFTFEGAIGSVKLRVTLRTAGGGRWDVAATGEGAKLSGTGSPVTVSLAIGDDIGTTQVVLKGDD